MEAEPGASEIKKINLRKRSKGKKLDKKYKEIGQTIEKNQAIYPKTEVLTGLIFNAITIIAAIWQKDFQSCTMGCTFVLTLEVQRVGRFNFIISILFKMFFIFTF